MAPGKTGKTRCAGGEAGLARRAGPLELARVRQLVSAELADGPARGPKAAIEKQLNWIIYLARGRPLGRGPMGARALGAPNMQMRARLRLRRATKTLAGRQVGARRACPSTKLDTGGPFVATGPTSGQPALLIGA